WDGYRWSDALSYKESGLLALAGFAFAALLAAWWNARPASSDSPAKAGAGREGESALYWLAFFLGFAFYMAPTQMHERYLLYAFPALLLAATRGDGPGRRAALVSYVALSVLSFVTISA